MILPLPETPSNSCAISLRKKQTPALADVFSINCLKVPAGARVLVIAYGARLNGVRHSCHSVKLSLSKNEFARDLTRHGEQRKIFGSSFFSARLDPIGSVW